MFKALCCFFLFYCPALDDYNIAEMGCLWVVYTIVPMHEARETCTLLETSAFV